MKDLVSGLVKKLREKGLRVTEQRKAILEALAKSEAPKSAEETFSALPADTCDLVTAYVFYCCLHSYRTRLILWFLC